MKQRLGGFLLAAKKKDWTLVLPPLTDARPRILLDTIDSEDGRNGTNKIPLEEHPASRNFSAAKFLEGANQTKSTHKETNKMVAFFQVKNFV